MFPQELVYDDILLIGHNRTLQDSPSLPNIFSQHLWEGTPQNDDTNGSYYRPLVIASFYLDILLFGNNYTNFHIQSLFWHLLCCSLLWFWVSPFINSKSAKVLAVCTFAFHPIQMEIVAFLAARNDAMACAGVLSMLLALRHNKHFLAGLSLFFALLCKESALLIPFVWVMLSWKEHRETFISSLCSLGIPIFLYFCMRIGAGISWPHSEGIYPMHIVISILIYAYHIVFPSLLLPSSHVLWPSTAELWGGGCAVFSIIWLFRHPIASKNWGRALCIAGIIPSFAAITKTGLVSDRYLYIPMVGICVLFANYISNLSPSQEKPEKKILYIGIPLIFLYLLQDMRILPAWNDNITLFSTAATVHTSPYQSGALAKAYEEVGAFDDAAFWYEQAVQSPHPYEHSCYNITWIHLLRGDFERIIIIGEEALVAGCPGTEELTAPLALAHTFAGNWDRASALTNQSTRDPRNIFFLVRVIQAAHNREIHAFSNPAYREAAEDALRILENSDPESAQWLTQYLSMK